MAQEGQQCPTIQPAENAFMKTSRATNSARPAARPSQLRGHYLGWRLLEAVNPGPPRGVFPRVFGWLFRGFWEAGSMCFRGLRTPGIFTPGVLLAS